LLPINVLVPYIGVPMAKDNGHTKDGFPKEEDEEVPPDYKQVIENWEELKDIPIQEFFSKGWKPRVKTKPQGKRYITLRFHWKDEDGSWRDTERGLGLYDPERWEALLSMYPHKSRYLQTPKSPQSPKSPRETTVLSAKVQKPKPLQPSVHLDLQTLQWYTWLQSQGYPGTLEDFLNDVVDSYFREYQKLELAVIIQRD
jgi:hypothetical protein